QARALKPEHRLAVGVFFFQPNDPQGRDQAKALIREVLAGGPVHLMGWRSVPTRGDMLPPEALASRPSIEQLILRIDGDGGTIDVERWLYRKRLELRQRFHQARLSVYVSSLSSTLVNYKGLLTSFHLAEFFPDLLNPAFETGLAIFHRRYSTNTYPNWTLAQPFRFSCHNGEINTLRTNRNAVHAYARGLEPPLPGGALLTVKMSDSASLDEWLEHLMLEKN